MKVKIEKRLQKRWLGGIHPGALKCKKADIKKSACPALKIV
jgi:hypothetical protein